MYRMNVEEFVGMPLCNGETGYDPRKVYMFYRAYFLPTFMGVDHGGTGGTSPPQNLERGTLIQIVPPRFRP